MAGFNVITEELGSPSVAFWSAQVARLAAEIYFLDMPMCHRRFEHLGAE
jgi:hypothetical protein